MFFFFFFNCSAKKINHATIMLNTRLHLVLCYHTVKDQPVNIEESVSSYFSQVNFFIETLVVCTKNQVHKKTMNLFFFSANYESTCVKDHKYQLYSVKTRDSSGIYGRGTGGLQLLKWTSSLFTKLPLCSQNVSVDWWKCRTLRWSSHRIPLTALHGAASGPYTNKHLIFRPRAIIPSMSLSVKDITRKSS